MTTKTESIARGLITLGFYEVMATRTRRAFSHADFAECRNKLYLGNAGSLRKGKTFAESIPVNPARVKQIIAAGKVVDESSET
jgi:hypothetical protein